MYPSSNEDHLSALWLMGHHAGVHMQAPPPTRNMQAFTVWGLSGVPQRAKWGLGASASLAIRVTHLGHGYMLGKPIHDPSFLLVDLS